MTEARQSAENDRGGCSLCGVTWEDECEDDCPSRVRGFWRPPYGSSQPQMQSPGVSPPGLASPGLTGHGAPSPPELCGPGRQARLPPSNLGEVAAADDDLRAVQAGPATGVQFPAGVRETVCVTNNHPNEVGAGGAGDSGSEGEDFACAHKVSKPCFQNPVNLVYRVISDIPIAGPEHSDGSGGAQ